MKKTEAKYLTAKRLRKEPGVSYERKLDHKPEIGVIAEDVDRVVPEIVSRNPETKQIEGVNYAKLSALLIEAVKSQQLQIEQLQIEVRELKSAGLKNTMER